MRGGRTVFLDRDGVINVNRPEQVRCWEEFEFLPRSLEALALLADHGFDVIVVTNQSGVNRGLITPSQLAEIHSRMCGAIASHGGRVRAILYCPHRPDEGCTCRKPQPGLLVQAQRCLGVDLSVAVLVGDHPADLEAARQAGCRSMLVLSGRVADCTAGELPEGCSAVVPDLLAAAERIVMDSEALAAATGALADRGDGRAWPTSRDGVLGAVSTCER